MVAAEMLRGQPDVPGTLAVGIGAAAGAARNKGEGDRERGGLAHQRRLRSFLSTSSAHASDARARA
jgi:hypothetical protein